MKNINMQIDCTKKLSHINKEIYGHFSEHLGRCIYNGIFVGKNSTIPNTNGVRNDVIDALKNIRIPVLRWPGGCFADEYHWMDGIGDPANRKKMINTHWGGVVEDNSFGTHEFMDLCEQLECEPYIAANLGSGTVGELANWVEYMTFDGESPMADLRRKNGREKPWKLKYIGIGNESWGCGGNMRPEYYADLYRHYQTYCRNFSGNELFKVACGPNADDYNWTEKLLDSVKCWHTKAISLHYYTLPTGDWSHKGSATDFDENEYYLTISATWHMEELLNRHCEIMDKYDAEKKIGLIVDEWGCWYDVEVGTNPGFLYQQNTMRDALVAAINLNIFNEHSDRVIMANIAQTVNVLQSIILTEGEKMILTPTYHVFDMFKGHQDSDLVYSSSDNFEITCNEKIVDLFSKSVSIDKNGDMLITLANCSINEELFINANINGFVANKYEALILTSDKMNDHNDFDNTNKVNIKSFDDVDLCGNCLKIKMPPLSVVAVTLKK